MKRAVAFLAVAIFGLLASEAAADCCNDCGCQCDCSKVCRCVPTTKKVTKICYDCECEDFCIPGPSKICGYKCVCPDDCGECKLFHHAHKEPIWQPTCAKVKTRHKLVKKEEVKEVPSWKWEVVDLCPHCKSCCPRHELFFHQHAAAKPENATQPQGPADHAAAEDYAQGEVLKPVAQPAGTEAAGEQKTELVSHNVASKLKSMLLPSLAK